MADVSMLAEDVTVLKILSAVITTIGVAVTAAIVRLYSDVAKAHEAIATELEECKEDRTTLHERVREHEIKITKLEFRAGTSS